MILRAKWERWEPWREINLGRERHRSLTVAGVQIARLYQLKVTRPDRFIGKAGTYWALKLGNEPSTPYFRSRKAALERIS